MVIESCSVDPHQKRVAQRRGMRHGYVLDVTRHHG